MLKELFRERLVAAADEIFALVERNMLSYEEQLCQAREESERHRRQLQAICKAQFGISFEDVHQLIGGQEELSPQLQCGGSNSELTQPPSVITKEEAPETPDVKEEDVKREEDGAHVSKLSLSGVSVERDDNKDERLIGDQAGGRPQEKLWVPRSESDDTEERAESGADGKDFQQLTGGHEDLPLQFLWADYSLEQEQPPKNRTVRSPEPVNIKEDYLHPVHIKREEYEDEAEVKALSIPAICLEREGNEEERLSGDHPGEQSPKKPLAFFPNKSALIEHTRRHKAEKPFCCSSSSKTFALKGSLVRHMRKHTGAPRSVSNDTEEPAQSGADGKDFQQLTGGQEDLLLQSLWADYNLEQGQPPKKWRIRSPEPVNIKEDNLYPMYVKREEDEAQVRALSIPGVSLEREGNEEERPTGDHPGEPSPEKPLTLLSDSDDIDGDDKQAKYSCKDTPLANEDASLKTFICSYCCQVFPNKPALITHARRHTAEKPFCCSICSKTFTLKGSLMTHMRQHTGEKPFSCSVCSSKFSHKISLITHMRTHTGEVPFRCSVCNKIFSHKVNLVRHTKMHTGEKSFCCSVCSEMFCLKVHLDRHMITHMGKKPFRCPICNKALSSKETVALHMRSHTGEKPYSCSICGKAYTQRKPFMYHMTKKHAGE
ncbi:zinc finger protein 260-like [Corythoichthys intestinalis]|uniref:zinc finger protein 260-like n=1 Tax=Corythoichthys intestinalis TaxID=161448 RepID=UPI0025A54E1B|nr:zinc finger protein 260-like [Corythoichthys intestinalis]